MEKLLTPRQLGAVLGMAEQTIYNRLSKGADLPGHIKIDRLVRFRESVVQQWIDSKSPVVPQRALDVQEQRKRGRPSKAEQIARRSDGRS